MGNAPIGSGWLYSSEEQTLVLINIHDARNIRPQPGEEVIVTVLTAYSPPAQTRIGQPASVLVSADSVIVLEVGTASPPAAAAGKLRSVGELRLPLELLVRRCGRSVYHTWFPLQAPAGAASQSGSSSEVITTMEQFDKELRSVARDPRVPMVCLSLCPADAPEAIPMAAGQHYEVNVSPSDKCARFAGLMASHTQHARMLQSLYRQARNAQQGRPDGSLDISNVSNMNMSLRGNSFDAPAMDRRDSGAFDLPEAQHLAGYPQARAGSSGSHGRSDEAIRLKKEIESTTEEANKRINQASDAIRTLQQRLSTRETEHERLRQETARFVNDADTLDLENERLALQLERKRRTAPDVREQEVERLKREADVLKEQKEALVAILEDLYGAVDKDTSKEEDAGAAIAASSAPASAGYIGAGKEEGWTNMLPRPSELFASGVLEAQ